MMRMTRRPALLPASSLLTAAIPESPEEQEAVASLLPGLGTTRWAERPEAARAADAEVLATAVGPTVQRCTSGDPTA